MVHKIQKKQFFKKIVLKITNLISIFTISPVRHDIRTDLSFFYICSVPRNDLSSLSRFDFKFPQQTGVLHSMKRRYSILQPKAN